MRTTDDNLLDGRLRYAQPADGYRTGIEPVLLAAATPARPGDRVLEAGTGAGAAIMCLAARVPGIQGVAVEIDPAMAALARRNIAANALPGLEVHTADILAGPPGAFDHVMANPPWHDPAATASPLPRRALAKQQSGPGLPAWIAMLARSLAPSGRLTLILPASLLPSAGQALQALGFAPAATPLHPKHGRPPKLALLAAQRPGPPSVAPPLVLHEADGSYTPAAQAILRDGAALG